MAVGAGEARGSPGRDALSSPGDGEEVMDFCDGVEETPAGLGMGGERGVSLRR